jgi:hypothetical protein
MLLLWPVFLGYVGWRGRAYFRTRWAYAAILAFLVGISPLILYNLVVTDFGTLKESREQSSGYQEGRDKDFSYRGRATEIAQSLPRIVASAVDREPLPAEAYLRDPRVLAYTALAILGLIAAARLGTWSLPLAVMTFLLLLPLFPAGHDNLPRQGRYLMPLLPLVFAGIGGLAAMLWVRTTSPPSPSPSPRRRGMSTQSIFAPRSGWGVRSVRLATVDDRHRHGYHPARHLGLSPAALPWGA